MRLRVAVGVLGLAAIVASLTMTPVGAHVGGTVQHLWANHVLPRLGALPDCGSGEALQGYSDSGSPICTAVGGGGSAGRIVASFKDQFRLTTNTNQKVDVARLNVPAGDFAITGKLTTGVPLTNGGVSVTVECELNAGGDLDRTRATVDAAFPYQTMVMTVVHRFSAPGQATLRCGYLSTSGDMTVTFVKMTGVEGRDLQNNASA
ncbi:MAG: hypothetical protein M3134_00855 [Actinomycetota bacterium]|nr:hypothetical protein [Actinomycetota bacterium]